MKIAVIGAGILGQLLAFRCVNLGHEVTLFDKHRPEENQSCSMAAAGLLAPLAELEKGDLGIYRLGLVSLALWPQIIKHLGADIFFALNGSLLLATPANKADLAHYVQRITDKLGEGTSLLGLNQQQITQLEPELSQFTQAYYLPEEGAIDSQALLSALSRYLLAHSMDWQADTEVQDIAPYRVKAQKFDWVLDCRGLGGKSYFADLRGLRGELIWLHAPQVKITRPLRLIQPRSALYLVPRADSLYLIGATEIETEDRSEISVRSVLELLSSAYYLHPGFAEARMIKTVTHCRPTLFDHKPKMKYTPGLIAVNGLYRHGFLLAPALVEDIVQVLSHDFSAANYPDYWERCDANCVQ